MVPQVSVVKLNWLGIDIRFHAQAVGLASPLAGESVLISKQMVALRENEPLSNSTVLLNEDSRKGLHS